jgi:hypothetical protein
MLPTDAKARKAVPLFSGCMAYFPDALAAVAQLSKVGNDQHNPGQPLHWAREKSQDEADTCARHLHECGTVDTDGVLHSVKAAWRALALAQKDIELHSHRTLEERQAWLERHKGVFPYPTDRVPPVPEGAGEWAAAEHAAQVAIARGLGLSPTRVQQDIEKEWRRPQ